ncbi:Cathepsin B-like cysteine proteinase [Schistosoma japonicum]|uniref:Cathepsin B-like cysteine proteinase n=1 Tax=Schistosoma japonicum TaxID=6182 RepID=A0A4Z2DX58_SCHJA|nr:Cathepsin B-like cysteine proteinase [Schistosoma japonicum]
MNLSNSKKKKMIMNLLPIINLILLILIENSCYALHHYDRQFSPLSDELITFINKQPNIEWKADRTTRFTSIHHAKSMMGVLLNRVDQHKLHHPIIHHNDINIKLPKYFDSRKYWKNCSSIRTIRDQSSCGSCWAFGAVESMSDRICIHSKGRISIELSAVNLLSCCSRCGFGCNGGIPGMAWDYWKDEGIVTGGSNETHTGCQPYPFPECIHHSTSINHSSCEVKYYSTPECYQTCQPDYAIQYENDKYYGKSSYYVTSDEVSIMKEILLNGPVEATFYVFDDFLNYKTGVYKYVTGSLLGGHAIRIIGWGVSSLNHTPYWLCANSWNKQWGDKGYFKILRGSNECGIESMVTAGLPK